MISPHLHKKLVIVHYHLQLPRNDPRIDREMHFNEEMDTKREDVMAGIIEAGNIGPMTSRLRYE